MKWLLRSLLALELSGCGGMDDRPVTLEYVTLTVLAPSCGTVACHSTTSGISGYELDTVEGVRATVHTYDLDRFLREIDRQRMPPDAPMSDLDIQLLRDWIDGGAEGL